MDFHHELVVTWVVIHLVTALVLGVAEIAVDRCIDNVSPLIL